MVIALINNISPLLHKFAVWIKKLFNFNRTRSSAGVLDYDDEIETVKPQKITNKKKDIRNKIRSAKRDLKTIRDPAERVRYIYGSALCILRIMGISIEKSDTTIEIYIKSMQICGIDQPLFILTGVYNRVRYGNYTPDATALMEAENQYTQAVEMLRQKKWL